MKEKDDFKTLFQGLSEAKIPVKEGFWEGLEKDLPTVMTPSQEKAPVKRFVLRPLNRNWVAAASVLLVVALGSIAFWSLDTQEQQIQQAFSEVAANVEAPVAVDEAAESVVTPIHNMVSEQVSEAYPVKTKMKANTGLIPASFGNTETEEFEDDDDEMVPFEITWQIVERGYVNGGQPSNGYSNVSNGNLALDDANEQAVVTEEDKESKWALKPAVGTSLPKGDFKMPLTAGLLVERKLSKRLSVETGLLYNYMPSDDTDNHSLALPVKLGVNLAEGKKVDLYASVGGVAEKLVGKGCSDEPVQLAATAGLGVRYKLNDNLAIYAEPSVSHHFDTDSNRRTLRSEQNVNLNLLCGVRMSY